MPHTQRYSLAAQFVTGKRVLDAACGVGYGARMLAVAGASAVIAVDISEEALDLARRHYCHDNVQFIRADCQSLAGVEGPFDVVVALECLEHWVDVQGFLGRVTSLLSPCGIFVCSTPNGLGSGHKPQNPHHVAEYTVVEFESLLRSHFAEVQITGQHWTAAAKAMNVLWSNPFVRFGRWLQRIRGHRLDSHWMGPMSPPTEGDLVMSPYNLESAYVLMAVCRQPKRLF